MRHEQGQNLPPRERSSIEGRISIIVNQNSSEDGIASAILENEHPGQALREDYLEPLGITPYLLAKGTGLSQIHVSEILRGKRSITPMTSLLLGKFFGISPRFWLNMQNHYDLTEAQRASPDRIKQATYYADLKAA